MELAGDTVTVTLTCNDCGVATPVVFEGLVYVPVTTEPRTTDYVCSGCGKLEYLTITLERQSKTSDLN